MNLRLLRSLAALAAALAIASSAAVGAQTELLSTAIRVVASAESPG